MGMHSNNYNKKSLGATSRKVSAKIVRKMLKNLKKKLTILGEKLKKFWKKYFVIF